MTEILTDAELEAFEAQLARPMHRAKITAQWDDCGAIQHRLRCSCGYEGLDTDGRGCWQEGHNVVRALDAAHTRLLAHAEKTTALGEWQPGPTTPMCIVFVVGRL
jgi:hypothetical protein